MKLKNPLAVRAQLHKSGLRTILAIAEALDLSPNTVGRALRGESVNARTLIVFAERLDQPMDEIAEDQR